MLRDLASIVPICASSFCLATQCLGPVAGIASNSGGTCEEGILVSLQKEARGGAYSRFAPVSLTLDAAKPHFLNRCRQVETSNVSDFLIPSHMH